MPSRVYLQCQEGSSEGRVSGCQTLSLHVCGGGGAWKYGIYLCQFSQQSSGKYSKCGSYEVMASHTCHLPRYFKSKENRVNSCPGQNRKTFISINPSSPVLIFIFAFSDIPTPAGQTPDLIPVQPQMCSTWMGTLQGPGYMEKPAHDLACKQVAGWWVCPSQQTYLLWVPALQGAWNRAVFRDDVHFLYP